MVEVTVLYVLKHQGMNTLSILDNTRTFHKTVFTLCNYIITYIFLTFM